MAITFNTGTAADSASTQNATQAVTIPAGVHTGDEVLFVACVVPLNTNPVTMAASSTATTPVQIGTTQQQTLPAPGTVNVSIWKLTAGASDPGATVTFSMTQGGQTGFWSVSLGAWAGTAGASAIDVSGGTISAAAALSVTCPSRTTGVAGDWAVYLSGGTYQSGTLTGPAGTTQREKFLSSAEVATAIFDSAASVGGAGTGIGGGTFTDGSGNANAAMAAFTIGLAPAGAAPPATSGLLLTAFP